MCHSSICFLIFVQCDNNNDENGKLILFGWRSRIVMIPQGIQCPFSLRKGLNNLALTAMLITKTIVVYSDG